MLVHEPATQVRAQHQHAQRRVVLVQPAAHSVLPQQAPTSDMTPLDLHQLPQVEGVHVLGPNPLGITAEHEHRPAELVSTVTAPATGARGVQPMQSFLRGLGVRDTAVASNAMACQRNGIETPTQFEQLAGRTELRNLGFQEDDIDRVLQNMKNRSEQEQERIERAIAESLRVNETELQASEQRLREQDHDLVNRAIAESLKVKESELQTSERQLKKWEEDLAAALSLSLSQSGKPMLEEQQQLQRTLELSALEALEREDATRRRCVEDLYDPEPEQPDVKMQPPAPEPEPEQQSSASVPKVSQSLHAQLLQMLEPMSVGELRRKAEQEGVDAAKIDAARDSRDPKSELSSLIVCNIVAALRRGEQYKTPAAASTSSSSPEADLRAELEALDVGQLWRRAEASGVDTAKIEVARDSHNPTRELMTLLLEQAAEHRAAGVDVAEMRQRRLDHLRVELASVDVSSLCHRAKQEGVEARLVEDARMRIDVAPSEALIALIVAKRGQAMGLQAVGTSLNSPPPPPPRPGPMGQKGSDVAGPAPRVRPNYAPVTQRNVLDDFGGPSSSSSPPLPRPIFQGP